MLDLLGILESDVLQWGLFSVLSLVCLAFFRKPLLERMNREARAEAVDSLVGELATAAAPIAAGEHGRAEVRGSTWTRAQRRCRARSRPASDAASWLCSGLELDIRSERSR